MPIEPYGKAEALKYAKAAWRRGSYVLSQHAEEQLAARDMTVLDVENMIRHGNICRTPEQERGTWRYTVETDRMAVVIAFAGSATTLAIVTAWRKDR